MVIYTMNLTDPINSLKERQYLEKGFMDSKKDSEGRYYVDTLLRDTWEDCIKIVKDKAVTNFNVRPVLNLSAERFGFDTQKPEGLIKTLLNIFTDYNNLVMDYFSGSGTTIATAHKLNRKWIGVEMGEHFYTFNIPRMKKVLIGDQAGISQDKDVDWQGGGAFKYYELEQYEDTLSKAKYKEKPGDPSSYSFMQEEKLLEAINVNKEKEKIEIDFNKLYEDIDIAETISNLIGKKIKKLEKDKVEYEGETEVDLSDLTLEKYPFLKPLIWWKSKE